MKYLTKTLKKLNWLILAVALLTFIIGYQVGHVTSSSSTPNLSSNIPANASHLDFSLFWQTWNLLNQDYVDKKALDPQKMYYGAIQGMVASLGDPYTVFLPPQQQQSIQEQLGGSFEGVGMELGYDKNNQLVVIAPLQGTPAEKAGIKAGDYILKINGQSTANVSLPDAVNQIRGPKGTSVSLQVLHQGDQNPTDVSIQRDTIVIKSVAYSPKITPSGKNVAYIRLSSFGQNTDQEWNDAVTQALAANPQGVILDVRNNPGGYLDDAVYIGSEFISSGNIVLQEDGHGNRQGYKVNRVGRMLNIPLVVLINRGSASAAEIVSGSIQDHKRGTLVGEQSFGKGTIQTSQDLPGGTGIHITIAKWLTPNGRWIHHIGLTPDVKVDPGTDPTKDPQLDKALQVLDNQ